MIGIQYEEFVSELSNVCNADEVHQQCCVLCQKIGFDYFIYGAKIPTSFVKPRMLVISGYPEEWREHYIAQDYLSVDPTVSFCNIYSLPLIWDRVQTLETDKGNIARFWGESRDFGLRSGISIPIHDGQGGRAMLSLVSREEPARMQRRITEVLPFLHSVSFHVHEAARQTLNTLEVTAKPFQLSNREIECLRWAAEGKTSWETSQILGISERTVIFHLQNVSDKMQVSNRSHAVARAVSLRVV